MSKIFSSFLLPWLAVGLFGFQSLSAQPVKQKIKVTDMLNIRQVTQVAFQPGGESAVYVLNSIEPDKEKKDEYVYLNRLALIQLKQPGNQRMLTGKEGASQPAWSPDGQQLAFVRAVEGKPQIFLMRLDGGEAIQLTQFRYGATNPVWHPQGQQLLFTAQVPLLDLYADEQLNPGKKAPAFPLEKPGVDNEAVFLPSGIKPDPDGDKAAVQAWLQNNLKDKKAKVIHHLNFQEETSTSGDISFSHLFLISATPGATPRAVTSGFGRYTSGAFTPDGKQILITGNVYTDLHPDRVQESSIFIADTGSTQLKKWLGEAGWAYNSARISPSGKWVAFQKGKAAAVDIPELYLIPMNGTLKESIALPFDRNKGGITWSQDEKSLYFTAQSNGGIPLYRADIGSRKIIPLTAPDAGVGSFDLANNRLLFVQTNVSSPFEIMLADVEGKNQQVLSTLNSGWLTNKEISFPEKRSFVNEEGMTVEYWIMKPAGFEAGKKYATILNIHGGPSAMWGPGENSMWHEFQYYCSRGYVVVYANPRGSGGYGSKFLRANMNNWGVGPARDVLTALEKAAGEGYIDTNRLAVTGGSYAGYLVAWIISHDQRFKAACSQRGVYELTTFMGEGNAWRLVPNYFGGYPWQPEIKKVLDRESPLNYVENIRTPYIIFHGENDLRTGVIQSEMIYRSLKILGRPVEYVRHPGASHEITRSGNNRQRMDQMLRTLDFFERYIRP
jgi:dipeptidyl aminopeptidase/acylaminoacyl peptidase